jgi:hypothetical protein
LCRYWRNVLHGYKPLPGLYPSRNSLKLLLTALYPLRSPTAGVRMEGANFFKAMLDGANLAGAFLYGAQFLDCAQLIATRNWQSAFRDATLGCGAAIPERTSSG